MEDGTFWGQEMEKPSPFKFPQPLVEESIYETPLVVKQASFAEHLENDDGLCQNFLCEVHHGPECLCDVCEYHGANGYEDDHEYCEDCGNCLDCNECEC